MSTLILGFGYKARTGKDSAANAIINARGGMMDIRKYSFASALKREVNQAAEDAGGMFALFTKGATSGFPLPNGTRILLPEWVTFDSNSDMLDEFCPLGKQRKLLQWWGSDYRRQGWGQFYWIKQLKLQIEKDNPQVALVTDVRFRNELLWVKAHREMGYTVKMERLGFCDLSTNPEHLSERDLDGVQFDFVLTEANGDMATLSADAVTVFDTIVKALSELGAETVEETADEGQSRL